MEKSYTESIISAEYLNEHPDHIFVFGDNTLHKGLRGAAKLRYHDQSMGFITKKKPSLKPDAYYKPREYKKIFDVELSKLMDYIENNPKLTFMISKLGSGLANRFNIWEKIIHDGLMCLQKYPNVIFLFKFEERRSE